MTFVSLPMQVPENLEELVDYVGRLAEEFRKMGNDGMPIRMNKHVTYMQTTTPGANVEFTLIHNLGFIPFMYVWNVDAAATIYDSRKSSWTQTQMFLKCSVATVGASILVLA